MTSENGYYNTKFYSGEVPKKIEEEVKASLFTLPNEKEIEEELKQVELVKTLYQEQQQKQEEYERQKAKMDVNKLDKIEQEQKRLASRLEFLVNQPKENEQEEIFKLISLKRKIAEAQKQEIKILEDQHLLSKEKEIEEKVRKKIELERILQDKTQLNDRFSKIKMEIDLIQAEENDRVNDSKRHLEKALKRTLGNEEQNEAFKKGQERAGISTKTGEYLSESDKQLLGTVLLGQGVSDQKEKELVLNEIQGRREQEKRKIQLEISEKQRSLNDQRFELMEESEKLLKKKVQHHELQKKGVDFLASVEQGLAPPMEFILKNLPNIDEDKYRSQATIEEIVLRAKKFTRIGQSRIEFMRSEHQQFYGDPDDRPYQGELKPLIQRMNPENVYISRLIIDWLIELVIRKNLENKNELAATREKQHYLQEKAKRLQKNVEQYFINIREEYI